MMTDQRVGLAEPRLEVGEAQAGLTFADGSSPGSGRRGEKLEDAEAHRLGEGAERAEQRLSGRGVHAPSDAGGRRAEHGPFAPVAEGYGG